MDAAWIIGLALYLTILCAVVIVLLMRILSLMEIVVRAIPLGTPRVQERRPPSQPVESLQTRPVGATATAPTGRHG